MSTWKIIGISLLYIVIASGIRELICGAKYKQVGAHLWATVFLAGVFARLFNLNARGMENFWWFLPPVVAGAVVAGIMGRLGFLKSRRKSTGGIVVSIGRSLSKDFEQRYQRHLEIETVSKCALQLLDLQNDASEERSHDFTLSVEERKAARKRSEAIRFVRMQIRPNVGPRVKICENRLTQMKPGESLDVVVEEMIEEWTQNLSRKKRKPDPL